MRWRTRAVRILRQAGYVVRREWEREEREPRRIGKIVVPSWFYRDGPAASAEAVDPWKAARTLLKCGSTWFVGLRWDPKANRIDYVPTPRLCSQGHWCPVCAPRKSHALAEALRIVVPEAEIPAGRVHLATLTQRAHAEESLFEAVARWRDSWRRATRGRPGKRLKALVRGVYYGVEATRGAQGRRGAAGRWWHLHAHAVFWLREGVTGEDLRAFLHREWQRATGDASADVGKPGFGWRPSAGEKLEHVWQAPRKAGEPATCSHCRRQRGTREPCAPWLQPVRTPAELYQAAKYPTPIVDISPRHAGEFLAVAHGKRWHQGTGDLLRVLALAEALEEAGSDPTETSVQLSSSGPDEAPDLKTIDPAIGFPLKAASPALVGTVRWTLLPDLPPAAIDALKAAGFDLSANVADLPATDAAVRVRESEELRARERAARPRDGPSDTS